MTASASGVSLAGSAGDLAAVRRGGSFRIAADTFPAHPQPDALADSDLERSNLYRHGMLADCNHGFAARYQVELFECKHSNAVRRSLMSVH